MLMVAFTWEHLASYMSFLTKSCQPSVELRTRINQGGHNVIFPDAINLEQFFCLSFNFKPQPRK